MKTPESIEEPEIEELKTLEKERTSWSKNKPRSRKQGPQATKDQVAEAMKKFLKGGGKITKLVSQMEEY